MPPGHQSLLQNGLSVDPRYSATYGNPYLRNSNASLPPPSTANPAATPAPPPYVKNIIHCPTSSNSGISASNYSALGLNTSSLNSSIVGITSATTTNQSPQQQTTTQQQLLQQQQQQQVTSPSGQFILPSNGNLKKGSLATHV